MWCFEIHRLWCCHHDRLFPIGLRGGVPFEFYILAFSPPTVHDGYTDIVDAYEEDEDPDAEFDVAGYNDLYQQEKTRFGAFLYNRLSNIGTKSSRQKFLMTMYLKFKGLSNAGQNAIAEFGWCMPKSTYVRHKTQQIKEQNHEIRSIPKS